MTPSSWPRGTPEQSPTHPLFHSPSFFIGNGWCRLQEQRYRRVCSKRCLRGVDTLHLYTKVTGIHSSAFFICSPNPVATPPQPYAFFVLLLAQNRETGPEDLFIKVLYCGICHTDIHQAKNHLGMSNYPMVPGYFISLSFLQNLFLSSN